MAYLILAIGVSYSLALVWRGGRGPGQARRGLALLVLAVGGGGTWVWHTSNAQDRREARYQQAALPRQGGPFGYVSSAQCAACHPDEYYSWHRSFHRTMTQPARPDTVRGDFHSPTLTGEGFTCRLARRGEEFWIALPDPDAAFLPTTGRPAGAPEAVWRRVGMLTGSHQMQVYWVASQFGNLETVVPFAYLFRDQRWVPLKDTFLRDPRLPQNLNVWNEDCIKCHSTAGQPRPDPLTHIPATRVGELGIACEACHGPAAAHVAANANPVRRYLLHGRGRGDPTIVNPARLPSKLASEVCGQCHGIKWIPTAEHFAQNGFSYRPGQELNQSTPIIQPTRLSAQPWLAEGLRRHPEFLPEHYWSDGTVRVSGRDYNGLIDSPCYQRGELSCLSCHSMHRSDPVNQLGPGMAGNGACLQCHKELTAKVAAHTHHPVDSSGSLCYNCHMPYTTYGLLRAIRGHRIESPSVAVSVQTGRPNGCNLCHLDRSLGWTERYLTRWYGVKPTPLSPEQAQVSAAVLWALRGDAGQRALIAWHMGWTPAREASGQQWLAPYLAQLLTDPYAAVRYIAGHSLQTLPGFGHLAYDYLGTPEEQVQARDGARAQWAKTGAADRHGEALLLDAQGGLEAERFARLLRQRDDRSMDLQE